MLVDRSQAQQAGSEKESNASRSLTLSTLPTATATGSVYLEKWTSCAQTRLDMRKFKGFACPNHWRCVAFAWSDSGPRGVSRKVAGHFA